MKLTNTQSMKRKSGMTLLELTVVILVLLSLISILFVGARAWKRGSDRAGCILNIRNVQQAVRGHMNTHPELTAAPAASEIYDGSGNLYMRTPACPAGTTAYTYDAGTGIPAAGHIFLDCAVTTVTDHVPANTADW
jgi:prepilin-type N-terminal cleavage/methylation domain-containing protein